MTRSEAREIAVRLCYSIAASETDVEQFLADFFSEEHYATLAAEDERFAAVPEPRDIRYITEVVTGVGRHWAELDGYIEKYAKGWKFDRISRTALAIMRTAMYEILYVADVPTGAAINEAVELAKRYEEEETVPFVNGVLGSFARGEAIE